MSRLRHVEKNLKKENSLLARFPSLGRLGSLSQQ